MKPFCLTPSPGSCPRCGTEWRLPRRGSCFFSLIQCWYLFLSSRMTLVLFQSITWFSLLQWSDMSDVRFCCSVYSFLSESNVSSTYVFWQNKPGPHRWHHIFLLFYSDVGSSSCLSSVCGFTGVFMLCFLMAVSVIWCVVKLLWQVCWCLISSFLLRLPAPCSLSVLCPCLWPIVDIDSYWVCFWWLQCNFFPLFNVWTIDSWCVVNVLFYTGPDEEQEMLLNM